ncbi:MULTISPECIES: hypothetical protein [Methylobacter]
MDAINTNDSFEMARNSHIQTIIHSMESSPQQWDNLCQININWLGEQFISRLSDNSEKLDKEKLDDIFSMCFRFLFELYLSMKNDLALEYERARKFAFENIDNFEQDAKEQIEFAIREMPIAIFKSIANSDSIDSIKDFDSLSSKAKKLKEEWESDLSARESRVEKLKQAISTYETAFNFVGLFQGFDELATEKKTERDNLLFWLRVLGILVVSPIVAELIFLYSNIRELDLIKEGTLISVLPIISLVGISMYYFRVILFNYKSVKSQLLQIELRKTLCRFIQHYSDYSSELKKKDQDSLSKFENIIFSAIVSDDDKLPSAYDGIEQIGKLIKSAKS